MYLTDSHDGNPEDEYAYIPSGNIIPYDQVLTNLHNGFNTAKGMVIIIIMKALIQKATDRAI